MTRLPRLLPVALIAVLLGVQAAPPVEPGPTYKIVGPDGKITFSDRKPTDPNLHTRALGQTVVAPLLTPTNALFDLHPQNALPVAARSVGSGDAPPVDISGRPFPPGLPDAVLDVLVHQFFVQTMVETCDHLQPAYADRYHGGVRNWRDRNSDILAKSNRILFTRFTGEQRELLRMTGRARLAQLLAPPDAAQQDKMAWCDRMSTDLVRRQFELLGDMRVAPILYYDAQ